MGRLRKKSKSSSFQAIIEQLAEATKEDEVRLIISNALGISLFLKLVGSTDGYWDGSLFEFKYNKVFYKESRWSRSAYQTLAQAIYYCRKILNYQIQELEELPHSLVICDKNGGFIVKTESIDTILCINPDTFSTSIDSLYNELKCLLGSNFRKKLDGCRFSWTSPPSSQDEGLVKMLEQTNVLDKINYYDFSKSGQLELFLNEIKDSEGNIPQIPITKSNFIPIYERWFKVFAPRGASKRVWADRYVMDLRLQYELDKKKGVLTSSLNSFEVPVDRYVNFWKLYRRPPEESVDRFIATNKDLLFDVLDQNNYGDFYTPLKVADLAQAIIFKHINYENSKRIWWDSAAGGGNLFFKFAEAKNVILTTKFENDVNGLKSNSSVKSTTVLKLDFINDLLEKDILLQNKWKEIKKEIDKSDELVFFINPPFDDQAESRGSNLSLPDNFFDERDINNVNPRALRAMHTRFLYRIMSIARSLNKKVYVAAFSKTGWVVGPDSENFYQQWAKEFKYKDGFIISSKVFNGVKGQWPCLFSMWEYSPKNEISFEEANSPKELNVYDKDYKWIGVKTLIPFSPQMKRFSSIAKLDKKILGPKSEYLKVVPLKNEYEVADKVYENTLPKGSLGYLRMVANDVYNSTQRVQVTSSMYGPSNHNGVPITKENFEEALAVYGIRKCIRRTWLNDKDEFYFPKNPTKGHQRVLTMSALYTLIDGAYASSMGNLNYKGKKYSFRNQFFICSSLEVQNWGGRDYKFNEPFAVKWIKKNRSSFSDLEKKALSVTKALIKETFKQNNRAKGETARQIKRGDAGIRQLVNGLIEYKGADVSEALKKKYSEYLAIKELLREELESECYKLSILLPFDNQTIPSSDEASSVELEKAAKRLQKAKPKRKARSKRKAKVS